MSSRRVLDLLRRPGRQPYRPTFNDIFCRLTAAECVALCNAYGLLSSVPVVGTGDGECPSELSAEGALSWMMWNEGRGEWYTTSTPADISPATMRLWLDAKDQSSLFSDAGVTQITDGGAVQQCNDKSGGGRHFSQATAAYRPTWSAAGYINFPGYSVDNNVLLTSGQAISNFLSAGDNTIFVVATVTVNTANLPIIDAGGFHYITWTGTGFKGRFFAGAVYDATTSGQSINVPYILMSRRYGGSASVGMSVNGGAESVTATSGNLTQMSHVLAMPSTGNKESCRIHEVIIHNAALGDTDRNNLGLYLASKHNTLWLPKINDYRYRGNLFAANRRAHEVRDYLEARYNESRNRFMDALGATSERGGALCRESLPAASWSITPRTPTKIIFWDSNPAAGAGTAYAKLIADPTAGSGADARSNLVRGPQAFYGQGGAAWNAYNVAAVKSLLDAQPAGRRCLVMGAYKPIWAKPDNSSGVERYGIYDKSQSTAKRRGQSLETWWAWANDPANGLRKFLADLAATGASLDYLITDVELTMRTWQLQRGSTDAFDGTSSRVAVTSVNTSTNALTSVGHGFTSGDVVAFYCEGGGSSLPAPLVTTKIYYIRSDVTADTFTVAETSGGAAVDITSAGAAIIYALRESWAQMITDANWTANHGNLASGVRGMIRPVMDQEVWKAIPQMSYLTAELGFNLDAHISHYFGKYFSKLLNDCKASYPNLIVSDYGMGAHAPGTVYTEQSASADQYGAGHTAAGVSSPPMYGDWYGERWNWSTLSNQSFSGSAEQNKWAAFLTQIMRLRSAFAGTHTPQFQPWLSHEIYTAYQLMGTAGLWAEFVLHSAMLSDGVVNFYQPTDSFGAVADSVIAANQRKFIDLIEECDDALAYESRGELRGNIETYQEGFVASRVFAGRRWVWRVTPNPTATNLEITPSHVGARFDNSLGSLFIPRGVINYERSLSDLAPLGWWVEQGVW